MSTALVTDLTIFVLALLVGIEVIGKVPATLHTPLMSATNSIHGIVLAGALLIGVTADNLVGYILAFVASVFASANVVGGYLVTERMLKMFRRKAQPQVRPPGSRAGSAESPRACGACGTRWPGSRGDLVSGFTGGIQLVYVVAAACFVIGLHLMNSPGTARRGNQVSIAGMVIAGVATLVLMIHYGTVTATGWIVLISGTLIGSAIGLYAAQTVQMTAMPQLVSTFNSVGGGAAALVAIYELHRVRVQRRRRARHDHGVHAARRDHRRGDLLRVDHRGGQAAGPDAQPADHLARRPGSSTWRWLSWPSARPRSC